MSIHEGGSHALLELRGLVGADRGAQLQLVCSLLVHIGSLNGFHHFNRQLSLKLLSSIKVSLGNRRHIKIRVPNCGLFPHLELIGVHLLVVGSLYEVRSSNLGCSIWVILLGRTLSTEIVHF